MYYLFYEATVNGMLGAVIGVELAANTCKHSVCVDYDAVAVVGILVLS